ncbi:hypothetical protein ABBQ38_006635 [Trebouxia sp. C0009 RCD-2024]
MMDNTAINSALVVALVTLTISWCANWRTRWKYRHIPGPVPSFPLGNLGTVRKKMMFRAYADWQAKYGDFFKIFMVRKAVVVTSDPAVAWQVTVKEFNKFHDRFIPNLDKSLKSGIRGDAERSSMAVARGAYWGSLRAGVPPMFHNNNLTEYAVMINQAVDALISNLRPAAKTGELLDIHHQLGRMTMQVIGGAAFGVKFDTQEKEDGKDVTLVQAAKAFFANSRPSFWKLTAFLSPKVFMPVLKILSHAFPTNTDLAMEEALATVYEASDALIKNFKKKFYKDVQRPAPWKWFPENPNNPYKDTVPAESSVISTLLKANNKVTGTNFSHMQIATQTNLMLLAGYETTANALAFCIYLLGKHPHAQQKLLQEVDAFKGSLGYDNLSDFPYVQAVLSETLRLYPPAGALSRFALEDVQLGPYWLPEGTPVHIDIWSMHHDERWWQDAEVFKPERWLGDKNGGDKSGGHAYMPFGAGPRMCIGIKLAREPFSAVHK